MRRTGYRAVAGLLAIAVFATLVVCLTAGLYAPVVTPGQPNCVRVTAQQVAFGVPPRAVMSQSVFFEWGPSATVIRPEWPQADCF